MVCLSLVVSSINADQFIWIILSNNQYTAAGKIARRNLSKVHKLVAFNVFC